MPTPRKGTLAALLLALCAPTLTDAEGRKVEVELLAAGGERRFVGTGPIGGTVIRTRFRYSPRLAARVTEDMGHGWGVAGSARGGFSILTVEGVSEPEEARLVFGTVEVFGALTYQHTVWVDAMAVETRWTLGPHISWDMVTPHRFASPDARQESAVERHSLLPARLEVAPALGLELVTAIRGATRGHLGLVLAPTLFLREYEGHSGVPTGGWTVTGEGRATWHRKDDFLFVRWESSYGTRTFSGSGARGEPAIGVHDGVEESITSQLGMGLGW